MNSVCQLVYVFVRDNMCVLLILAIFSFDVSNIYGEKKKHLETRVSE